MKMNDNLFKNISIERLIEIENEREATQLDPNFQQWMKDLNVSRLYVNKDGIMNARNMMNDYSKPKTYNME
jgi:hypothetical protein